MRGVIPASSVLPNHANHCRFCLCSLKWLTLSFCACHHVPGSSDDSFHGSGRLIVYLTLRRCQISHPFGQESPGGKLRVSPPRTRDISRGDAVTSLRREALCDRNQSLRTCLSVVDIAG